MKKIPQDIVGTIAILKFKTRTPWLWKKIRALQFLRQHKNVHTIVEKTEGFKGNLRIQTTKHLAGKKTKTTTYKENGCTFNYNIDETYFSPRLAQERKEIAEYIAQDKKKNIRILVLFAGIAPYPIIIAKKCLQQKKQVKITAIELNKKAVEQGKENIKKNKVEQYITIETKDAKKITKKSYGTYDYIIMPRPKLQETFLKNTLPLTKKGTTIIYHGFGTKEQVKKEIEKETKNNIGKIRLQKAGDIGKKINRWRATFNTK
jgi:tRNA (guanine37-N1)-methyltransferase